MSAVVSPTKIEQLGILGAADLRMLWQRQYGAAPPPTLTARLMRHALAWQMQAKAHCTRELSKAQKSWAQIMTQRVAGADAPALPAPAAGPGTRLLKDWGGTVHEVLVGEDSVLWNGQRYRSLSAVARAMTGTNRNGPKFFGLRG